MVLSVGGCCHDAGKTRALARSWTGWVLKLGCARVFARMDLLQQKLGGLLTRPVEDAASKQLSGAARARVDVLRALLRTPAVVGDDEYERLLKGVFDATSKLLGREPTAHRGPESEKGWELAGFQATAPDREFRGGGLLAVWKSTNELGYPENYCGDLCEPPRHLADAVTGTTRVHGMEPPRHRADAVAKTPPRGAPEI